MRICRGLLRTKGLSIYEDCNLKEAEEEECTDPIEEALRNILEKEAERMRNK